MHDLYSSGSFFIRLRQVCRVSGVFNVPVDTELCSAVDLQAKETNGCSNEGSWHLSRQVRILDHREWLLFLIGISINDSPPYFLGNGNEMNNFITLYHGRTVISNRYSNFTLPRNFVFVILALGRDHLRETIQTKKYKNCILRVSFHTDPVEEQFLFHRPELTINIFYIFFNIQRVNPYVVYTRINCFIQRVHQNYKC